METQYFCLQRDTWMEVRLEMQGRVVIIGRVRLVVIIRTTLIVCILFRNLCLGTGGVATLGIQFVQFVNKEQGIWC